MSTPTASTRSARSSGIAPRARPAAGSATAPGAGGDTRR
ncbi:hypothetical protein HNP84_002128 [Thermocatellispora tengchongensis]|uniref:Uncharacterized protein n=1 Tax=Thermocatellispora tengchongensis TaxID=1073253 RepID=A0A840NZ37_9ACTN|nr:hypothetical protein [Thermocatellispora tengchongensis]